MDVEAGTISAISLGLIAFVALVLVVGIYQIHSLPGRIASQRGHPQTQAIEVCSVLGLLIFPLWMAALVWAYAGVVGQPLDATTASVPGADPSPGAKREDAAATAEPKSMDEAV
jgi:hypothetical protein